ncbi:transposase [Nostoc sp.]|uniref:transposase n=1 Tax=Nostoc sp. TaxID=1180 RepID=UPI003FA5D016
MFAQRERRCNQPPFNLQNRLYAKLLEKIYRFHRLIQIWIDGGYSGKDFIHWVIDVYRWILSVVTRHEEQKGFVILPKHYLVERTFGWFNW